MLYGAYIAGLELFEIKLFGKKVRIFTRYKNAAKHRELALV